MSSLLDVRDFFRASRSSTREIGIGYLTVAPVLVAGLAVGFPVQLLFARLLQTLGGEPLVQDCGAISSIILVGMGFLRRPSAAFSRVLNLEGDGRHPKVRLFALSAVLSITPMGAGFSALLVSGPLLLMCMLLAAYSIFTCATWSCERVYRWPATVVQSWNWFTGIIILAIPAKHREELVGDFRESIEKAKAEGYGRFAVAMLIVFKILIYAWIVGKLRISDFVSIRSVNK